MLVVEMRVVRGPLQHKEIRTLFGKWLLLFRVHVKDRKFYANFMFIVGSLYVCSRRHKSCCWALLGMDKVYITWKITNGFVKSPFHGIYPNDLPLTHWTLTLGP